MSGPGGVEMRVDEAVVSPRESRPASQGNPTGRRRGGALLVWAGLLVLAVAVRLVTWPEVFSAGRIRFLADTDPHYHVLRARRMVENFPSIPWTDPGMNHPVGAVILWPPLFDLLIALPAKMLGGGSATIERVAAVLPVALGLATVWLVGALGTVLLGRRGGLMAAALMAVLPLSVQYTILGRPDQHAMELVAFSWVLLAFVGAWRAEARPPWGRWHAAGPLGVAIAVSFWNWQGSALYLLLLAVFTAAWHLWGAEEGTVGHPAGALTRGGAVGAGALATSVALFTPDGLAGTRIMGVSGFHVMLVLLTTAFAWGLGVARTRRGAGVGTRRRLAEVCVAGLLPFALVLALAPGFRASVHRGLIALAASNAWYANINEFQAMVPLLLSRHFSPAVTVALGGMGLLLAGCLPAFVRRARRQPDQRAELAFLFWVGVACFGLWMWRLRFGLYAGPAATLWLALGLEELASAARECGESGRSTLARALPVLGGLCVVAPMLPMLLDVWRLGEYQPLSQSRPVLEWLGSVPAPRTDRQGVLAPWDLGHAVQYYARKPVLVSPFGTDGGEGAMEDAAAFYLTPQPDAGEALLTRRGIGFVLLTNPASDYGMLAGFVPEDTPKPVRFVERRGGVDIFDPTGALWPLPVSRLYFLDGAESPDTRLPALDGYRLLFETPSTRPGSWIQEAQFKLFGVVPGAAVAVRNARPAVRVVGQVWVLTNSGRPFVWSTSGQSDAVGTVTLRVPYATGLNGQVRALPSRVSDGERAAQVVLTEAAVTTGETVGVDLGGTRAAAPSRSAGR